MKFGYTILYVQDVERTVSFYETAFGFQRNFVHESGYGELQTGETKLAFASFSLIDTHKFAYVKTAALSPALGFEIAFVTDDVQAAFMRAVNAGCIAISAPEKTPWGQTVSYVRDQDGFTVELCSPVPT